MSPLAPIVVLLLGAVVTAAGGFLPRFRMAALVPPLAALLAVLSALVLGLRVPAEVTISGWGQGWVAGTGLVARADRVTWLFSVALLLAALSVFLTGFARSGGPRLGTRAATLLIAATALAAILADNLVTLAVTWAALDVVYFVILILLARSAGTEKPAVLSLAFNSTATFLAVAAALDTFHQGQPQFLIGISSLTERSTLLLFLAVIFRLGVFPFHLALAGEAGVGQGLGAFLRLAPAAVAFSLLTRILAVSSELPLRPWLSAAAAIGLLVAAAQWWEMTDPRGGLSFVALAQSSLAILAALWGGQMAAAGVLALGLGLILGGCALFLNNGYNDAQRGWIAPSVIGALTLAGAPLTVGFVGVSSLYGALAGTGSWVLFAAAVLGQTLLVASYIRLAFWPGEPVPAARPALGVAYLFGLAAPLALAVIGGLAAGAIGSSAGVAAPGLVTADSALALGAVAVAALGGFGLWYFESVIRGRADTTWAAVASAARLEWLYFSFWEVYRFVGRALRTAADIVEGEGGVLWTIVAALLVWLLLRGR